MAATSTRKPQANAASKPTGAAGTRSAGLTPIWIRLPRLSDDEVSDGEPSDLESTARTHEAEVAAAPARPPQSRSNPLETEPCSDTEDDEFVADEMPEYLRRLAEASDEDESAADERSASRGRSGREKPSPRRKPDASSAGFFSHLFRAPYNILAGIALVIAFVAAYMAIKPASSPDETLPTYENEPSLTLDLGQPSFGPMADPAATAEAVDPSMLYPESSVASIGEFRPAGETTTPIAASAHYGGGAATSTASGSTSMGSTSGGSNSSATQFVGASKPPSDGGADVDPKLSGLPLETYPETDPSTYRYSSDATIDLTTVGGATSGDRQAPRAASLGDSLEKPPVR